MAKDRVTTHLVCENCKQRNYSQYITGKSKRKVGTLQLRKYCPHANCRGHFTHKEIK